MRYLVKIIKYFATIILLCFIALVLTCFYERERKDPIVKALSVELGDKKLILGSKINEWTEHLGQPDLRFDCYRGWAKNSKPNLCLAWKDYGVAVTSSDCKDKQNIGECVVNRIIIPRRKEIVLRDSRIENPPIKFNKLANPVINNKKLSENSFDEIDSLYRYHFDGTEYSRILHNLPILSKYYTSIQYNVPTPPQNKNFDEDDIELILIYKTRF